MASASEKHLEVIQMERPIITDEPSTVHIGRVCQPCADSWKETYSKYDPKIAELEMEYTLVDDPLHCEECEGETADEKPSEKYWRSQNNE